MRMMLALLLKQSQDFFIRSHICLDRHIFKWFIGDYYVHCGKSTHFRNLASQEMFYFIIQAVLSLPSPSSVISTSPLPYLPPTTLLLSFLDTYPPDPNKAWQQSFLSSGHHLLALPPSPHLFILKGFDKGKPVFTRARIHLDPVTNDFSIWLRSVYPQSQLKPKNKSASKEIFSLQMKRLFAYCCCKCPSKPCVLHMCKSLMKSQSHNLPSKPLQAFTCQEKTRTRIMKVCNSFLHLMSREWLGIEGAFRIMTLAKRKSSVPT